MPRPARRCISVRWIIYSSLLSLAHERDLSVSALVDSILVAELERLGHELPAYAKQRWNAKRARVIPRRRRSITVREDVFALLERRAEEIDSCVATLLDALCCAELGRAGRIVAPVATPNRSYQRGGRRRQIEPVALGRHVLADGEPVYGGCHSL